MTGEQQPEVRPAMPEILISINEQGQLICRQANIGNVVVALGMLELAKTIVTKQSQTPQNKIVPATAIPRLNGHG